MDPFTISLTAQGIGAAVSFASRQFHAREQRQQADEAARRLAAEHAKVIGEAGAAGASSGAEFDSRSLQNYLGEMRAEFDRQEWTARRAGLTAADATSNAANAGLLGDLGGALFSYAGSQNWFKAPAKTSSYDPAAGMYNF